MLRGPRESGAFCRAAVVAGLWLLAGLASAQGIGYNVDLDIFGGPPQNGNGAPTDAFAGAAGQPGRWNRINAIDDGPRGLVGIDGLDNGATITLDRHGGPGQSYSALFQGNTGDFAALFNDFAVVGDLSGGHYTYDFAGLLPGEYRVVTYAVTTNGATPAPIYIPEAIEPRTQIVTGPMPGNAFQLFVTHSQHFVFAPQGEFHIDIVQQVGLDHNVGINGFQVVPVPEPGTGFVLIAGTVALACLRCGRRRRAYKGSGRLLRSAVTASMWLAASLCAPQGIGYNVDLDIFGGPPQNGNGAPTDSFAGAAGQAGRWNRINAIDDGPRGLVDIDGLDNGATITLDRHGGPGLSGSGFFPTNTGDFAALLNDFSEIGGVSGGHKTYLFAGLTAGEYRVITYAVNPLGATPARIYIPEAFEPQTQIVTGPMPGNSFQLLVTHSDHTVFAPAGEFHIDIVQQVGLEHNVRINGFQIVPVPEAGTGFVILAGCVVFSYLRRGFRLNKPGR